MILPKDRDLRFITIRRGGTLTDSDHRLLALWAAAYAEAQAQQLAGDEGLPRNIHSGGPCSLQLPAGRCRRTQQLAWRPQPDEFRTQPESRGGHLAGQRTVSGRSTNAPRRLAWRPTVLGGQSRW